MAYFYLIKNIKLNKYYAGSRSYEGNYNEDLFIKYFTSSKTVLDLIQKEGISNWLIDHIIIFDNYNECVLYEDNYLRNIKNKNDYLNLNFSAGGQIIKSKTHTYITNDEVNYRQHNKDIPIPEGYYIKWPFKPPTRKGYKTYINIKTKERKTFSPIEIIPNDWIYITEYNDQLKKDIPKRTLWITNSISNTKIKPNDIIPEGWYLGKIRKQNNKPSKKRNKSWTTGKIFITNGLLNKLINPDDEIPEGWNKGQTNSYYKNGRSGKKNLKFVINGITFRSMNSAIKYFNLSKKWIIKKIENGEGYYI